MALHVMVVEVTLQVILEVVVVVVMLVVVVCVGWGRIVSSCAAERC